jgi:hypothetical protein
MGKTTNRSAASHHWRLGDLERDHFATKEKMGVIEYDCIRLEKKLRNEKLRSKRLGNKVRHLEERILQLERILVDDEKKKQS